MDRNKYSRTKYERQCGLCCRWFVTEKKGQQYCGASCAHTVGRSVDVCYCKACGKGFRKRTRKKDSNQYCSRACGGTAKGVGEARSAATAVSDGYVEWLSRWRFCCCGAVELLSKASAIRSCEKCRNREHWRLQNGYEEKPICQHCGVQFERLGCKKKPRTCTRCANRIKAKHRRAFKKLDKAKRKQMRRLGRAVYGVAVSPDAIFERDKWLCQMCGVKTSKDLPHNHDRYPNLDHAIPLSKGGEHAPDNLQCLCRRCNLDKSDRLISLF